MTSCQNSYVLVRVIEKFLVPLTASALIDGDWYCLGTDGASVNCGPHGGV